MLIKKLKQYPKLSQGGNYLPPTGGGGSGPGGSGPGGSSTSSNVQSNLYTSGSEYQLPDGTEYIGSYHIHPGSGAMVGPVHTPGIAHDLLTAIPTTVVGGALVGRTAGLTPSTRIPTAPPPYNPSLAEINEYEKYIASGSTYKSNIVQVNTRDTKGNVQLSESGSNNSLIFEVVSNNFTNRSIISAVDTQFQFFKFPAQISTTVQDLEFDESLLDIDVQQGILNDPYQGKLIRNKNNKAAGRYFVQGTTKRRFRITADSIWALKNNLPPFSNINGDLSDSNGTLDNGESNYDNYNQVTRLDVAPGIFNGYTDGEDYFPEDAFAEGNVYGKVTVELTANNTSFISSIPNSYITITGPDYGETAWSGINADHFTTGDRYRFAEVDVFELPGSYVGIISNIPDSTNLINVDQDLGNSNKGPIQQALISSQFGFDIFDGSSYYPYIESRFRDYALYEYGNGSNPDLNIQPYYSGDKRPTYYLNDLESTDVNGNTTDWGVNSNDWWNISGTKLKDLPGDQDFTPWYKLKLPLSGLGFKLFVNDELVTGRLRDATNNNPIGQVTHNGYPYIGSVIPFQNPSAGVDDYQGWILNFDDLSDISNVFTPNTNTNFRLDCDVTYTNNTLDVYFIGICKNDNGGNFTSADRDKIVVVPQSITFADPATGNNPPADGSSNALNQLKNADWGFEGAIVRNWDTGDQIHF